MEKSKKKTKKIVCPHCKGNGYIRIPYHLAKEEITAQCGVCDSEGEINAEQRDDIYVDSDGIHRLQ
jgi:DnaJ-class molecular chaperone